MRFSARVVLVGSGCLFLAICLMFFAFLKSGEIFKEVRVTNNTAAVAAADSGWRTYEIYDPRVEQVTIYDADFRNADSRRIIDPETGKVQIFCEDTYHSFGEHCYWKYEAPAVYNHMSALAYYDGLWYAMWGTNDKKSRVS